MVSRICSRFYIKDAMCPWYCWASGLNCLVFKAPVISFHVYTFSSCFGKLGSKCLFYDLEMSLEATMLVLLSAFILQKILRKNKIRHWSSTLEIQTEFHLLHYQHYMHFKLQRIDVSFKLRNVLKLAYSRSLCRLPIG